MKAAALFAFGFFACSAVVLSQGSPFPSSPFPTAEECSAQAEEKQAELMQALIPCFVFDLTPGACCTNVNQLVNTNGTLEYCLCDSDFFDVLSEEAADFGLDIGEIGAACNDPDGLDAQVPFNNNTFCPTRSD